MLYSFRPVYILCFLLLLLQKISGQSNFALTGSAYAGSFGIYLNPASSISSKDSIDISLPSLQFINNTNFVNFGFAPLLSKNPNLTIEHSKGDYDRDLIANLKISLIGVKYKISPKTAIGFGMNLRSFINIQTSHYNFTDSSTDIFSFLEQNTGSLPFKANASSSNWLEYVGNISHNLIDKRRYILNVGANLSINKGLLGLAGSLDNLQYRKYKFLGTDVFEATNADFVYGYSANAMLWDNTLKPTQNVKNIIRAGKTGASIDLGAELLLKNSSESDWFYEGLDYNYTWKLGFSILDLGFAKYEYFSESAKSSGMRPNMTPDVLLDKFTGVIENIADFNDTLSTVVSNFENLKGNFKIYHPSKFIINVDKRISNYLYINTSVAVPFSIVNRSTNYVLKDVAFLSITPRMETRRFGLYIPFSYNTKTQFHLGVGLRAGPLLFGVNNLNIFNNSQSLQNTSGYLSLLFKWKRKEKKINYNFLRSPKLVL